MRKICLICCFLMFLAYSWGQDSSFGKITITPYITSNSGLDATARSLLSTKMNQIVTANNAVGGFEKRFVITPAINILSEKETATIPQKTSMKVSITFFVGDGVAGTLFNSYNVDVSGIGDDHNHALYAAIRKINAKNAGFQSLINEAKDRIESYYNSAAPVLLKEAENYMAVQDYEGALSKLGGIPSICPSYSKAKALISKCGNKIIDRDNKALLTKAKAAWSANPNEYGAKTASDYLAQVVISSSYYQNEVESLTKLIQQRLVEMENKRIEFETVKILSEERLETERINASARVMTSLVDAVPSVLNVLSWF